MPSAWPRRPQWLPIHLLFGYRIKQPLCLLWVDPTRGAGDSLIRLWNLADRRNPTPAGKPLTGHTGPVRSVAFSTDGRTLASASDDNTVRLWTLDVEQATARICATTRNILTPDAWRRYVSDQLPFDPPCD